ncbi:MAG: lipopolysaccharide heptosyltransferase II [Pseudomonadota bacterium]
MSQSSPATAPVLVAGPSWVGDMVMAQSLFKVLKARRPDAPVDVLAPGWCAPIVMRMPEVRACIESPFAHGEFHWSARRALGVALRERGYGRAIVIPRSFKAALVPFHARIPRRTGYRGEMRFGLINDMRGLDKAALPTTVSRYVALAGDSGEAPADAPPPALRVDCEAQQKLCADLGLSTERPVVALMPGAEYGPAKQWPAEHFGALAKALDDAGFDSWVFGSAGEAPIGEEIAAASPSGTTNLCGKTKLTDVVDLIALCRVAVSNDSGLMHVAAATGRHVVALYGSSSPEFTPPLTPHATVLKLDLECSPCFARTCRFDHYKCLRDISAQQVLSAVRDAA